MEEDFIGIWQVQQNKEEKQEEKFQTAFFIWKYGNNPNCN